jgi:hypothetical protein
MTRKKQRPQDELVVLRTGDFEDLEVMEEPSRSHNVWLPWTMFMLLLTAVTSGGLYFGLPLYDELTKRRSETFHLATQLKEARDQLDALTVERDTLSSEKARLTSELSQKAQALEAALSDAKRANDLAAKLQAESKKKDSAHKGGSKHPRRR